MRLVPWRRPRTAAVESLSGAGNPAAGMRRKTQQRWQSRAAFFARNLGAIRFALGIKADSCSRCDLMVEKCVDVRRDVWEPVEKVDDPLTDALHAYRNEQEPLPELIRQHVWQYEMVGELLQCMDHDKWGRASWSIRSVLHAEWRSDGVLIREVPGGTERDGTAKFYPWERVKRLWVPDWEFPQLATSALQGVLPDCERYWALARRIRREAESALVGNGIIWSPGEAHQRKAREEVGPGGQGVAGSNIDQTLYEYANRALNDDDGPEAVAPLSLHWNHEYGPPQTVEIGKAFDPAGIAYRDEALNAIGRGLDYPQKLFTSGGADVQHWGAWLLAEEFARHSVGGPMQRVCWRDLTETFLRPAARALQAKNVWDGNPDLYRVGFDLTPIVVHPDKSKTAIELYGLGVLSDETLVDASGFDVGDIPSGASLGRWLMRTAAMKKPDSPWGSDSLPVDGASTVKAPPALESSPVLAAVGALNVASTLRPSEAESVGWLDL